MSRYVTSSLLFLLLFGLVAAACGSTPPEVAAPDAPAEQAGTPTRDGDPESEPLASSPTATDASDPERATGLASAGADQDGSPPADLSTNVDPMLVTVATARDDVTWVDTRETPDGAAAPIEWGVWNPTPFGTTLAMLVTEGQPTDEWVKVQVAVRPNHSEAWVRSADFVFSTHRFRAEIDVTQHQLTVWEGDEQVVKTLAVTGKATTPTPLGRFYVNDLVTGPNQAYGPWVLSLSAYSEALDTFGGGEPVIAIHGTNQPELIGSAASNGCIRIPNDIIELLAEVVPLGTPVDIVA